MQAQKQTAAYMDGEELRRCREVLGLSIGQLAAALRLPDDQDAGLARWEAGADPVPGPVSLAVEYLLFLHVCGEPMPAAYRPPAPLQGIEA